LICTGTWLVYMHTTLSKWLSTLDLYYFGRDRVTSQPTHFAVYSVERCVPRRNLPRPSCCLQAIKLLRLRVPTNLSEAPDVTLCHLCRTTSLTDLVYQFYKRGNFQTCFRNLNYFRTSKCNSLFFPFRNPLVSFNTYGVTQ